MAELRETVYQESAPRVDAEAGILYGVKLLGMESRNGRKYTEKAIRNARQLYEGRKIYVNHPRKDEQGEDRQFESWAGESRNPEVRADGIYGNVHLRKKSDYFEGIIEAAERFPKSVGFSHVADGESRFEGDTEIVESIKEVFSVDLVTDPATTEGFFESKRRKLRTFKAAIESLPESTQRTRLIEMAGEYGISDMAMDGGDSVGKAADPLGEIAAMCRELIKMLGEALVAKNTPPPQAPPVPNANPTADPEAEKKPGEEDEDEEMKPEDKEKIAAFESVQQERDALKAKTAELEAKSLLLESGREATPARIKALAAAQEADRKELLESWTVEESIERPFRSPPITESADSEFDFSQSGSFAARYR